MLLGTFFILYIGVIIIFYNFNKMKIEIAYKELSLRTANGSFSNKRAIKPLLNIIYNI